MTKTGLQRAVEKIDKELAFLQQMRERLLAEQRPTSPKTARRKKGHAGETPGLPLGTDHV